MSSKRDYMCLSGGSTYNTEITRVDRITASQDKNIQREIKIE
jgi:hypothetical protein